MPVWFEANYRGAAALFRGGARAYVKVLREAWRLTGQYWLDELLPLRFAPGAVARYHLRTKRSVMMNRHGNPRKNPDGSPMTYGDWKKRIRTYRGSPVANPGQDVPLILSGDYMRQVLSPTRQTVKSLPKGRGVKISLRHDGRCRSVVDAVRNIPGWEKQRLEKVLAENLARLIKGFKKRVRRKIRAGRGYMGAED